MDWLTIPTTTPTTTIQAGYYDPHVLNQGEIHIPVGPGPARGRSPGSAANVWMWPRRNTANGTAVQFYYCNGSAAQQWTVRTTARSGRSASAWT